MSLSNDPPSHQTLLHESPWTRWVSRPWGPKRLPYYCLELFDFVTMVAITPEAELLLVEQERPAVRGQTLELPSGLMDVQGESALQTASRELTEETGYRSQHITHVSTLHTDTGRMDNHIHVFFCDQLEPPLPDWSPESGIKVRKEPLLGAQKLFLQGAISNIMHCGAWFLCHEKGLLSDYKKER